MSQSEIQYNAVQYNVFNLLQYSSIHCNPFQDNTLSNNCNPFQDNTVPHHVIKYCIIYHNTLHHNHGVAQYNSS